MRFSLCVRVNMLFYLMFSEKWKDPRGVQYWTGLGLGFEIKMSFSAFGFKQSLL